jgi:hypothetical protein
MHHLRLGRGGLGDAGRRDARAAEGGCNFDGHGRGVVAILFRGDEHAADGSRLRRLVADFHRQVQRIVAARQSLRRRVFDAAFIIGKESQRLDLGQRRAPLLPQGDDQLTALEARCRGRQLGGGQFTARFGEERRLLRVDTPCVGARGYAQSEIGGLRDTHIGANQPTGFRGQIDGRACLQVLGSGNLHQVHGVLRITVIDQRRHLEAMRRGPDDAARGEARGQLPGEFGGFTGIPGVAPIGMPALANVELQGDPGRLAGTYTAKLADQPRLDIIRSNDIAGHRDAGRRESGGGEEQQPQQTKYRFAHNCMVPNWPQIFRHPDAVGCAGPHRMGH